MGIFDIFKTKVGEAADKAGDVAGDLKDKVADMFDGDKDKDAADAPEAAAEKMVSEGAPVADTGEAAPGAGDDGSGGMTGTIKQNVSSGADKAAEMADSATGGKVTDQIQTGADKTKDMLG
jgi:hypothetical protein